MKIYKEVKELKGGFVTVTIDTNNNFFIASPDGLRGDPIDIQEVCDKSGVKRSDIDKWIKEGVKLSAKVEDKDIED